MTEEALLIASVLHRGTSKYQEIALLDTKHFGKVRACELSVRAHNLNTVPNGDGRFRL